MQLKIRNIFSQEPHTIKIITDGSASPKHGIGAWASYIVTPSEETVLKDTESNATQHAMELKAVLKSLTYIQSTFQIVSVSLEVYTDSDYVLGLPGRKKKLVSNNFQTKKGNEVRNRALIAEFYEWLEYLNITLIPVEGHAKKGQSAITDYHREVDKLSRKLVRRAGRDQ